jgi:hypothetical protein
LITSACWAPPMQKYLKATKTNTNFKRMDPFQGREVTEENNLLSRSPFPEKCSDNSAFSKHMLNSLMTCHS